MGKGWGWAYMCLLGLCLFALLAPAWAQNVITPEEQYKKLIRVDQDIQPLGEHPFGENIGLYNGSLSFQVTDISASGNGPLLQLTRSFKIQSASGTLITPAEPVFADWALDLPRIQTFIVEDGYVYDSTVGHDVPFSGWKVSSGSSGSDSTSTFRCRDFQEPPGVIDTGIHTSPQPSSFGLGKWWTGYHLVIPGQGDQDLLKNSDATTQDTYPAVTKNHWRLSCIQETQTANGQPGDGFVAHAPDGTTYYFNELVHRSAPAVPGSMSDLSVRASRAPKGFLDKLANPKTLLANIISILTGSKAAHAEQAGTPGLPREMAYLLVTKIEDRFGNYLIYHYDANGLLTGITASDGRDLSITYDTATSHVTEVTLQQATGLSHTWTYSYATVDGGTVSGAVTSLTTVSLPNNSQWHYQFAGFDSLPSLPAATGTGSCNTVGAPLHLNSATGTITGPSGLTGTFIIKPMEHARSLVPQRCGGIHGSLTPDSLGTWAITPSAWYAFTITQRTLSGAGLPTRSWKYTYSTPQPSWADCTGSCPTTEWTKVENPDHSVVKRTFSNKYDISESHLLRTDFYASTTASTPLRSIINTYADPGTSPFPVSAGILLTPRINREQATKYSPLSQRVIAQDGDTYTWQAEAFDKYTHVTKTKRFNSIGGSTCSVAAGSYNHDCIESTQTYLNDTTNWVLGLPLTHTILTTNEAVSENFYNTDDLLTSRKHFGHTVMSYTWNADGQLASWPVSPRPLRPARLLEPPP